MTLFFSTQTDEIVPNPELMAGVPYDLAVYYQAIPLFREGDTVYVAMAHPENTAALEVLGGLLEADIVPLLQPLQTIQAALNKLRPFTPPLEPHILTWSHLPEWHQPIADQACFFGAVLLAPITTLKLQPGDQQTPLRAAQEGQYTLSITHLPDEAQLPNLLSHSATPLLFVRGYHPYLWRVLVVIRGRSSDNYALDWIVPFAWKYNTAVTLLSLTEPPVAGLRELQQTDPPLKTHLEKCLSRLRSDAVQTQVKFQGGNLVEQITTEIEQTRYDLLVIAAEAHGEFVSRILLEIEHRGIHPGRPILVIKPLNPLL